MGVTEVGNVVATEQQQLTFSDLLIKLRKYHMCCVIRPTGFGKTWLLAKLITEKYKNKRILYLYPTKIIKKTLEGRTRELLSSDETDTENTVSALKEINYSDLVLMSYTKLVRLTYAEMEEFYNNFDLIICDEAHKLGGPRVKMFITKLIGLNQNCDLVGATATPLRTDCFDFVNLIFGGVITYAYNIKNAFDDNVLLKPYYLYLNYNLQGIAEEYLETSYNLDKATSNRLLKTTIINGVNDKANVEILNMPSILQSVCSKKYDVDTDYMKFIVFFNSISHIEKKGKEVETWFANAFPKHNISVLSVSSESETTKNNIHNLVYLNPASNNIDLIFCIDMLNMGYHISDLTGIILYRGTKSSIIYNQQIGRALAFGSQKRGIIIDIVDNIHRNTLFDKYDKTSDSYIDMKSVIDDFNTLGLHIADDKVHILDKDSNITKYIVKDNKIFIGNKCCNVLKINAFGEISFVQSKKEYHTELSKDDVINITNEELVVIKRNATVCEDNTLTSLVRKALAEPIYQLVKKCRMCYLDGYSSWKFNKDNTMLSDDEYLKLIDLDVTSKATFRKEIDKLIGIKRGTENLIEQYLGCTLNLSVFAETRRISVDTIVNVLFR